MSHHVWYLTAPDGRVVGASARSNPIAAVNDAWRGYAIEDDTLRSFEVARRENPTASTYTVDGYTLARKEMDG